MAQLDPASLIQRHVAKLRQQPGHDKVDEVLRRCGIHIDGGEVTRAGRAVEPADCYDYKHAVKEIYGDAAYSFAKVNFVLGGCTCRDCV